MTLWGISLLTSMHLFSSRVWKCDDPCDNLTSHFSFSLFIPHRSFSLFGPSAKKQGSTWGGVPIYIYIPVVITCATQDKQDKTTCFNKSQQVHITDREDDWPCTPQERFGQCIQCSPSKLHLCARSNAMPLKQFIDDAPVLHDLPPD